MYQYLRSWTGIASPFSYLPNSPLAPHSLLHLLPPYLASSASLLSPGFQLENGCCGNVESYHKCVYVKKRVGDGESERERKKRRKGMVVSGWEKNGQGILHVERLGIVRSWAWRRMIASQMKWKEQESTYMYSHQQLHFILHNIYTQLLYKASVFSDRAFWNIKCAARLCVNVCWCCKGLHLLQNLPSEGSTCRKGCVYRNVAKPFKTLFD